MNPTNSPVENICVDGLSFFLKRDDLLHPDFSGNKARKLYYLLNQDLSGVERLIGFGSPQANSLYSLAVLAKMRQKPLDYYVGHIPSLLLNHPAGNYLAALDAGANIIAVGDKVAAGKTLEDYVTTRVLPEFPRALFVPEGGRYHDAAVGVNLLADEIIEWAKGQNLPKLNVALPSGTGTTALFLQKRFTEQQTAIKVLTCACVGGDKYLSKQFHHLVANPRYHPSIISNGKKYHFGKLYGEFYQMWQLLKAETDIEFDLLYDPQGWIVLLDYLKKHQDSTATMYIHQGGVLGNATMLPRYIRKYHQ